MQKTQPEKMKLKIKDNIDLSILEEKYGFTMVNVTNYSAWYSYDISSTSGIFLSLKDRIICLEIYANGDSAVDAELPSVILDLILDGLVEKC